MAIVSSSEKFMTNADQTKYSFNAKWTDVSGYQIDGANSFDSDTLNWLVRRNGFESLTQFASYLRNFEYILDAGCGNGRILSLFSDVLGHGTCLVGLDYASAEVARKNLGVKGIEVFDADLMDEATLTQVGKPDFIYCQEVLHHTADPQRSFANLCRILDNGGEIAIYVYKEKAPIREFTDDFVRNQIENLSYEEALELTNEITQLGRVLSELNVLVDIPEVKLLGISSGTYSVQRLLYHFFVKCYWNPELLIEINNAVNFDWYHPSICSRHNPDEVEEWFRANNLHIVHKHVDEYGITMRGRKPV